MNHQYAIKYLNIELKPLEHGDISALRIWRNEPHNSVYLRKLSYITELQQECWFQNYLSNQDELIFGIHETEHLHRLVGSMSLFHFDGKQCELGRIMIGDEAAHGQHIGSNAIRAILMVAFQKLLISKVHLHVYQSNVPAVTVYRNVGFDIESISKNNEQNEYIMTIEKEAFELLQENEHA